MTSFFEQITYPHEDRIFSSQKNLVLFKKGTLVMIPKGTPIADFGAGVTPSKIRICARNYRIKIHSASTPFIIWGGKNGWCWADANYIPDLRKLMVLL